jgi:hypothetical protein
VFLLADLVSLSEQQFEQLEMKTHDVKAFFDKVQKLYIMKDMGNPFMEETGDLFTLDTQIIDHPSVTEIVALMLKKLHQVIFSRLAGYENRREQTTIVF